MTISSTKHAWISFNIDHLILSLSPPFSSPRIYGSGSASVAASDL